MRKDEIFLFTQDWVLQQLLSDEKASHWSTEGTAKVKTTHAPKVSISTEDSATAEIPNLNHS